MPSETLPSESDRPAVVPPALRVLIVEDSEFDARILVNLLRTGGWKVQFRRVASAESLRAALANEPWDLILCDHTMPDFSAPEALQVLQQTQLDVPFIIISGGIEEGVAITAMKSGAHDFLMKGALGRLVPAVQRELKEAAVRRSRREAEAALEESELRYRSVWENSTDAVLLLDEGGIIRFANPAVEAVFGWKPADLAGRTLDELQPTDLPPGDWWQYFRTAGQAKSDETVGRRRDGSPVEIDLAVTEMRMGDDLWVVIFVRDVTERRRAERELRKSRAEFAAAREIQQRLFPKQSPHAPGFDIAGVSHPAEATGGDYFDFLPLGDDLLGLVVADVSGHGLGSSLLMAEARAYLRPVARRFDDPGDVMERTQELLRDDLGKEKYITMLFVRLAISTRTLSYSNSGHPAGQLLRADGSLKAVLSRSGRPLGKQSDAPFPPGREITLESGDVLLMLTDGIDEAMRSDGEVFGVERAVEVVRANQTRPAAEIVEALCAAAREFTAPDLPEDDLTVVVVKVL
ncbi:MAG TPA: SpoIIE family protein phosphatase [Verrucomicrobiota bacterium]|nr:SpoIIE family protein phosphatase [Verrucomicrobiota bacterium]